MTLAGQSRKGVAGVSIVEEVTGTLRGRFQRVFLFGSWARGDHLQGSDVDVIVVDGTFKGAPYPERVRAVRRVPRSVIERYPWTLI